MEINITGITNKDNRILVYFNISYKGNVYKWQDYGIGPMEEIVKQLNDKIPLYEKYIDKKEEEWKTVPKTREMEGMFDEEKLIVEVTKEEIVKPPIPDYVELRKREYPDIHEYIDGIVKNDQKQIDEYVLKCLEIKEKYPKDYIMEKNE